MSTTNYQRILTNLEIESLIDPLIIIEDAPYHTSDYIEVQVQDAYQALITSKRVGTSQSTLLNAYYLGELIETKRTKAINPNKMIPTHYYIASVRIYHIFKEIGKKQIMKTDGLTLAMFKTLPVLSFKKLVKDANTIAATRQIMQLTTDLGESSTCALTDSIFNEDVEFSEEELVNP